MKHAFKTIGGSRPTHGAKRRLNALALSLLVSGLSQTHADSASPPPNTMELGDLRAGYGSVTTGTDENGLRNWKLTQGALSLKLIQRLPDQTRAFFLARGFPKAVADEIATACVLQTIGRNESPANQPVSLTYDLRDWRLRLPDGSEREIRYKEDWDRAWTGNPRVPRAARIAFRWATFPSAQQFEPGGDYNWGMTSFGLPPGSRFDLHVRWRENGQPKDAWIEDITCPQDR